VNRYLQKSVGEEMEWKHKVLRVLTNEIRSRVFLPRSLNICLIPFVLKKSVHPSAQNQDLFNGDIARCPRCDHTSRAVPDPNSHGSRGIYERYTNLGDPGITPSGCTNSGVVAQNCRQSLRIRITKRVSTVVRVRIIPRKQTLRVHPLSNCVRQLTTSKPVHIWRCGCISQALVRDL